MPENQVELPQIVPTALDKLMGARKLIAGLVILLVGVAIAILKNDIPSNLLQLLQVLFGGFIVGNVGEHVVGAVTARADAGVQVAQIQADAAEPEPWDDEFKDIKNMLNQHDAGAQQKLTDILGSLQALVSLEPPVPPAVDLASVTAPLAEIKAILTQATTPPADPFNYQAAVEGLQKTMTEISQAQQINSKALSLIISRGGL